MARGAGIGNFVFVRHLRRDEPECVRVHKRVRGAFGFDLRHVTGSALASCGTAFVMRVFFESRGARAIWRKRPVAVEAEFVRRLN